MCVEGECDARQIKQQGGKHETNSGVKGLVQNRERGFTNKHTRARTHTPEYPRGSSSREYLGSEIFMCQKYKKVAAVVAVVVFGPYRTVVAAI